jgi:superfamily I DNA/RNA helicase
MPASTPTLPEAGTPYSNGHHYNSQGDESRHPDDTVYQWYRENPAIRPLLPENGFLNLKAHRYPFTDPDSLKELLLWMREYNPEQLEAAVSEGNLNITATAGSGKTTVLSSIAYTRIICGTHPSRLAVSSFTTTAAEEIAQRTHKLIHGYLRDIQQAAAEDIQQVQIQHGTLHSLALQELKNWKWARGGLNTKVLDPYQVTNLWREAIGFSYGQQRSSQLSEQNLQTFGNLYDLLRNLNVEPQNATYLIERIYRDPENENEAVASLLVKEYPLAQPPGPIIQKYEEIKQQRGLLDYTDLLTQWLALIRHYKEAYRGRWEYILVDEFQDTSPLQQTILEQIHELGASIITCGDPSQCINSFNGSDPAEQEQLTRRIKARSLTLTYNYRSSRKILEFANQVLRTCVTSKLPDQPDQILQIQPRPKAPAGMTPEWKVFKRYSDRQEFNPLTEEYFSDSGDLAAETIQIANNLYWELRQFIPNPTVAILYRTNADGDMLEKQAIYHASGLQQQNPKKLVPLERRDKKKSATIKGVEQALIQAVKFWLSPEGNKGKYFLTQILKSNLFPQIGDVKATALVNQLNVPITGPETAWIAFAKRVPNRNTGHMGYFLEAWEQSLEHSKAEGHTELTCTATAAQLRTFLQNSRQWDQLCEPKSDGQPIKQPGEESTLLAKAEEQAHQANFLASMEAMGPVPVHEFIQHREAQNESGRLQETANFQGIILATIHLAKGKEYDGVVLHDVSTGKLPHQQALEDKRPAYVGSHGIRRLADLVSRRIILPSGAEFEPFEEEMQDLLYGLRREVNDRVNQIKRDHTLPDFSQIPDPHKLMDPIEEERRLLYVAITRPRHRLILTTRSLFEYPFYTLPHIDHPLK